MKYITSALIAAVISVVSFAASASPAVEAQTPGSYGPKAKAEAIHNARQHGINIDSAFVEAERPGSALPQQRAEETHLKKQHGGINDSADQRMLKDASRL